MDEALGIDCIACLGWGSLVWRQGTLPVSSQWHTGGPALPIEFARQSENKRMTLVICPGLPRVSTRWALLAVDDIHCAKRALGEREWDRAPKNPSWIERSIGFWDRSTDGRYGLEAEVIAAWAKGKGLSGVVWTSLPCRIRGENGLMPSEEEVVSSLRTLEAEERALAEEYVRKAPPEVDTAYRRRLVKEFGWDGLVP